jgi:hypothetical protein
VVVREPLPRVITHVFQFRYGIAPLQDLKHIQSKSTLWLEVT